LVFCCGGNLWYESVVIYGRNHCLSLWYYCYCFDMLLAISVNHNSMVQIYFIEIVLHSYRVQTSIVQLRIP
jgi:hypothetical protein